MRAREWSTGETYRDSRTQLRDRDAFYADIGAWLDGTARRSSSLLLLVVDVEGLDFALRTFGPYERDRLVSEVGARIREAAAGDDAVYHISQGRFALVLADVRHREALAWSRRLVAAVRRPSEVAGVSYCLEAAVGLSYYPSHAEALPELVRTGVFACYQAQHTRAGVATFDRSRDEFERHRFRLMVDLENALTSGNGIEGAYQPKIELATGRCIGVEMLCRWHHPSLGRFRPTSSCRSASKRRGCGRWPRRF